MPSPEQMGAQSENVESAEALAALVDSYLGADTGQERDAFFVDLQQAVKNGQTVFDIIQQKIDEVNAFENASGDTTVLQAKSAEEILADSEEHRSRREKLETLQSRLGAV